MKNFNNPQFITFEGGEGSGKSTQSKKLHEYFLSKNIKAISTREIGGTKEAEEIRELLLNRDLYSFSELMLVMAARYEHINKIIYPALKDGYNVICDRFIDSTACYQVDNLVTIEYIFRLHKKLMRATVDNTQSIMPDVTFFMDINPQSGVKRSIKSKDTNKFENKNMNFHQEVYKRFKQIANLCPKRIKSIQCEGKRINEIHQEILTILTQNK